MEYDFMQKYMTENVHTAQGHLSQERQGIQATKSKRCYADDVTSTSSSYNSQHHVTETNIIQ